MPVLYYVSPQVWAWRRGRVRQIARWVDRMAVIFPFEVPFYEKHGVKVTFVGHPLLDTIRVCDDRQTVLARLGLDAGKTTIAILPGSRRKEVSNHWPIMLAAARQMSRANDVQFICVRASTVSPRELGAAHETAALTMRIVEDRRYDAVGAADLVWVASGTATLETGLLLKPMVIVYRMSWLTYGLARLLVKVDHIGMVNLIAGERAVPELIQAEFNPERLVEESRAILQNRAVRLSMIEKLAKLRQKLGSAGASERVADLAFAMMA